MAREIVMGRYYPTHSLLHELDPRTKLVALVLYVASVLVSQGVAGMLLPVCALALLLALSNVPPKHVLRGMKPILAVLIITNILNILLEKNLVAGILNAASMTVRIVVVIWGSNLLCLTTKPKDIAGGMEKGLGWMKALGLPVHDIATMTALGFRFVPILANEASRIMEAQKARGADFSNGGLIRRAKALVPVAVPLFVSSFKKADTLALAMDSRLYGCTDSPTSLKPLEYGKCDAWAYSTMLVYTILFVLARVFPCHLI